MNSLFETYNDLGELIVSADMRHLGVVSEQEITAVEAWYANQTLQAPSFMDKTVGIPKLTLVNDVDKPMGLFKFNEGGCACGSEYYSANSGKFYYCTKNYPKTSGYLDVFNDVGKLIWSAESARLVPRVTQRINISTAELHAGKTVYIGDQLLMMNGLPSIMYMAPRNSLTVGGLYMRFSGGYLTLQFKLRSNIVVVDYVNDAYGGEGLTLFLYSFGV